MPWGQNFSSFASLDLVKAASTAATSDVNSDSVDMAGYSGVVFFAEVATDAANNFLQAEQSAESAANFSAMEGSKAEVSANANVAGIDVYLPLERYVRVTAKRGTSTALGPIYALKYGPIRNHTANADAAEVEIVRVVSPDEGTP